MSYSNLGQLHLWYQNSDQKRLIFERYICQVSDMCQSPRRIKLSNSWLKEIKKAYLQQGNNSLFMETLIASKSVIFKLERPAKS